MGTVTMSLCTKCQDLCNSIDPRRGERILHYDTIADFGSSADSGCRLCGLIFRACLEKCNLSDNDSTSRVSIKTVQDSGLELSIFNSNHRNIDNTQTDKRETTTAYVVFQNFNISREYHLARIADLS